MGDVAAGAFGVVHQLLDLIQHRIDANGQTVYFKFLSFNLFGQQLQTQMGVSAVPFVPSIPNYPPPINVTWTVS